jgi:hypothetical protein
MPHVGSIFEGGDRSVSYHDLLPGIFAEFFGLPMPFSFDLLYNNPLDSLT